MPPRIARDPMGHPQQDFFSSDCFCSSLGTSHDCFCSLLVLQVCSLITFSFQGIGVNTSGTKNLRLANGSHSRSNSFL